jgi:hypothetical protein
MAQVTDDLRILTDAPSEKRGLHHFSAFRNETAGFVSRCILAGQLSLLRKTVVIGSGSGRFGVFFRELGLIHQR